MRASKYDLPSSRDGRRAGKARTLSLKRARAHKAAIQGK